MRTIFFCFHLVGEAKQSKRNDNKKRSTASKTFIVLAHVGLRNTLLVFVLLNQLMSRRENKLIEKTHRAHYLDAPWQ